MRLLVIGGTGSCGRVLVREALERHQVRVATRTPQSPVAVGLAEVGAELVTADLRDPRSLTAACAGVDAIVAAAHGFPGAGTNTLDTVDRSGNRTLFLAAAAAGVGRVLLVSVIGAAADAGPELFRAKWQAERDLRGTGLPCTVLRSGPFSQTWAGMLGAPVLAGRRATVFGRGTNPIAFVSSADVGRLALRLVQDPAAAGETVELGGPQNLTMLDVVACFETLAGRRAAVRHLPRTALRTGAAITSVLRPPTSRLLETALCLDTTDQRFDPAPVLARWPMTLTPLAQVAADLAEATPSRVG